jgi:hypothetical protein
VYRVPNRHSCDHSSCHLLRACCLLFGSSNPNSLVTCVKSKTPQPAFKEVSFASASLFISLLLVVVDLKKHRPPFYFACTQSCSSGISDSACFRSYRQVPESAQPVRFQLRFGSGLLRHPISLIKLALDLASPSEYIIISVVSLVLPLAQEHSKCPFSTSNLPPPKS